MLTHEIEFFIMNRDFHISREQLEEIKKTSPQIHRVAQSQKYDGLDIWVISTDDNRNWEVILTD